ncbi:MAG: DUF4214 domain-containing protein [Clostridia bacterium]|nr:DUF4214 domain-containing protein [Clostridia bacterium]
MNRFMKKIVTITLSASMVFSSICMTLNADVNQGVIDFVTRCYNVALNREPDKESLDAWVDKLVNGQECGISVAYGFVYSPEFQGAGYSNEEYVERLYNMLLGRSSDSAGKEMWVNKLISGGDSAKNDLFYGFANSQEFYNLCSSYDICAGFYNQNLTASSNANINCFVDRFYSICLSRHGDIVGQAGWAQALIDGTQTGTSLAYGFIFSPEFINSDTSNEYFVEVLYRTFMGREPDSLSEVWKHYLDRKSMSREEVFDSFAESAEFKAICFDYGIDAGEPCACKNTPRDERHFTGIYSDELILMLFDEKYANSDMEIEYSSIKGTNDENLLFGNKSFYDSCKSVELVGDLISADTYSKNTSEYCVRVYCDKDSDEKVRYGVTSIIFALDYENVATKQTDGENYYYDLTYKMPFDLFAYTQDITVDQRGLIFIVSDNTLEHLYMAVAVSLEE